MPFIKKIIDLILYSNFFIAACAVGMTWQTSLLFEQDAKLSPLVGLVFFATLFIYAIHRLVGLSKVNDEISTERYQVIDKYKHHIVVYALLGAIGGLVCFFFIDWRIQIALVIPAVLSLGYVLPVANRNYTRRLRDINFIKIFIIAIVWAYVTVTLPVIEANQFWSWNHVAMFLERFSFIFAITLPFDIRDLSFDRHHKVLTIPSVIGVPRTLGFAAGNLGDFLLFAYFIHGFSNIWFALAISAVFSYLLIHFSSKQRHDYYFTGLIDGTMLVQFGLVYWFLM